MSTVDEFKFAAIRRPIAVGIDDLDRGRFHTYNDLSLVKLEYKIGQCGRVRRNRCVPQSEIAAKALREK